MNRITHEILNLFMEREQIDTRYREEVRRWHKKMDDFFKVELEDEGWSFKKDPMV